MSARGQAVGIDIGGTKIAVATVEASGEVVREATIPTESERGFAWGARRIVDTVRRVLEDSGWGGRELAGVGIGCAGPVDSARGTILNPHTLPGWMGGDIVTPLRDAFGRPVVLENDADMSLLGECQRGAGPGFDPVVMLTFGTGIAGAALVRGEILRGASGEHPEMGHVSIDPRGPAATAGRADASSHWRPARRWRRPPPLTASATDASFSYRRGGMTRPPRVSFVAPCPRWRAPPGRSCTPCCRSGSSWAEE